MSTSEDVAVAAPSPATVDTSLSDSDPPRLDDKNDEGTGSSDGESKETVPAGEDTSPVDNGGNSDAIASIDTLDHKLRALRSCIRYRIPFVHDKLPVKAGQKIKLHYGEPGDAQYVSFALFLHRIALTVGTAAASTSRTPARSSFAISSRRAHQRPLVATKRTFWTRRTARRARWTTRIFASTIRPLMAYSASSARSFSRRASVSFGTSCTS